MRIFNRLLPVFFIFSILHSLALASDVNVIRHTVVPGDTLWDLSEKHLGNALNYADVKQQNNVGNELLLQPGKELHFISTRFYPGVVTAVTGQAHQIKDNQQQQLIKGSLVYADSIIQASSQSFITLQFANHSTLDISPNSLVVLGVNFNAAEKRAIPKLDLKQGSVELQVTPSDTQYNKLEINARDLVLGVRGTHFKVKQEVNKTVSEVLAGHVLMDQKNTPIVDIIAGEGVVFNHDDQTLIHEKIENKPKLKQVFYSQNGLFLEVEPSQNNSQYTLKVYEDAEYSRPVREIFSSKNYFVIAPDLSKNKKYYMSITSTAKNGLESYPLLYTYDLNKVSVTATKKGVEFVFPDCHSQWRMQLSPSKDFLILVMDTTSRDVCKVSMTNLPKANWYWRVFKGNNDAKDMQSGQVKAFQGNAAAE